MHETIRGGRRGRQRQSAESRPGKLSAAGLSRSDDAHPETSAARLW